MANDKACEREAREMLMCGLAFMIQKNNRKSEHKQRDSAKDRPAMH